VIFVLIGKYFRSREKIFLKKFIELLMPATEKTNSGGPAAAIAGEAMNAKIGSNARDKKDRTALMHGITELMGWARVDRRCCVPFPISEDNKLKIAHMLYEKREFANKPLKCTIVVRR